MLVRAAEKGIAGDGRVKMCNSKDAFEAACNAAGDNLVRARSEDRPNRPSSLLLFFFARKENLCRLDWIDRIDLFRSPPRPPPRRRSNRPNRQVAVQISTKTCGPCKVVYPHFAKLSEELADVTFCKIMGDHDADTRALMKEWGVRVVPLFMTFRNGEKVEEWSGAKPDVLREKVLAACTDAEKASVVNA